MTYQKTCERCGEDFEAKRKAARYCSDSCRAWSWKANRSSGAQAGVERVPEHPLSEVRAEQESQLEKARWSLLVREHLARTLLETGYVHSDDLDPLGVPDAHRNILGAQMGPFVQKGWMEEVGRRASANPSRKKAKSTIFRITARGRVELTKLVGSSAAASSPPREPGLTEPWHGGSTGSGESPTGERATPEPGGRPGQKDNGASLPRTSTEPLSLLPDVGAERPRSAFTDDEMDAAA